MEPQQTAKKVPWKLEHRHGLNEWVPMLPERAGEVASPEAAPPDERIYRCQRAGCGEVVRVGAEEVSDPV